jgi:hypothetical protein
MELTSVPKDKFWIFVVRDCIWLDKDVIEEAIPTKLDDIVMRLEDITLE